MKYGFDVPFKYQKDGDNVAYLSRRNISTPPLESLLYPPYHIRNGGPTGILSDKTVHTDIVHANGLMEYDVHNLYGTSEPHTGLD
jgi:alpha-glucosidase